MFRMISKGRKPWNYPYLRVGASRDGTHQGKYGYPKQSKRHTGDVAGQKGNPPETYYTPHDEK
jgi:hypothetical protein